jgi:hypothetical protein
VLKQSAFPDFFFESCEDFTVGDEKRPFHQVSVLRKQGNRLVFGHRGELVFQSELAVIVARGVEKRLEVAAIGNERCLELRNGRWSFANGFGLVRDFMFGEPFECLSAGIAVFINIKRWHGQNLACLRSLCKARLAVMKSILLEKIRSDLRASLERLVKAAQEAHAAATDPGSKAEGKYDTRSLEASYLAAGQARQVDELANSLRIFESLQLEKFQITDPIDSGALVEVELRGESIDFLLVPVSGGRVVFHEGMEITLLSPESGLYRKLLGMRVGEELDEPPLRVTEVS